MKNLIKKKGYCPNCIKQSDGLFDDNEKGLKKSPFSSYFRTYKQSIRGGSF